MKFCFIAQIRPSVTYGGGKAQYYLAQALEGLGHSVTLLGPEDFSERGDSSQAFQRFLFDEGAQYDVIDFDHNLLLEEKCCEALPDTLLVSRSVLLQLHRMFLKYPLSPAFKSRLRRYFTRRQNSKRSLQFHRNIVNSLLLADLVNVSSHLDVERAVDCGISRNSIVRFPFALDQEVVGRLGELPTVCPDKSPLIVFLGTFDFRKGCLDAVNVFNKIRQTVPRARMRILGAKGVYTNSKPIMELFPAADRKNVELHMRFEADYLAEMLSDATIGLFPSYHEGWPFSIMEQLAAGKPVIAYNAPGASEMLPSEWLCPPGDWETLADRCLRILNMNEKDYIIKSDSARVIVRQYDWGSIAKETLSVYQRALAACRA